MLRVKEAAMAATLLTWLFRSFPLFSALLLATGIPLHVLFLSLVLVLSLSLPVGSQPSSRFSGLTDEPVARSFSLFDGSVASTLTAKRYVGSVAGAGGKLTFLFGLLSIPSSKRYSLSRSLFFRTRLGTFCFFYFRTREKATPLPTSNFVRRESDR